MCHWWSGGQRLDWARWPSPLETPSYAGHGVDILWLVDPVAGHVDAHARREDGWLWLGAWSDDDAKIPPFDAVGLSLRSIWEIVGVPEETPHEPR